MAEMRRLREVLKMEKVRGRRPDAVGRQKRGAVKEAWTKEKKWSSADTGHKAEPGMLGSGIRRMPSLRCRVLIQRIWRMSPDSVNLISRRARWRLGLKEPKEVTVRLDVRRKEKKAEQNKAQTAAWEGSSKDKCWRNWCSIAGVIGCFWRVAVPNRRFKPRSVKETAKLSKASAGKPL